MKSGTAKFSVDPASGTVAFHIEGKKPQQMRSYRVAQGLRK